MHLLNLAMKRKAIRAVMADLAGFTALTAIGGRGVLERPWKAPERSQPRAGRLVCGRSGPRERWRGRQVEPPGVDQEGVPRRID
jgi:hypothetical protein